MVTGRWFERYAWVIFVFMAAFMAFEGVMGLAGVLLPKQDFIEPLTGRSFDEIQAEDPGVANYILAIATDDYWLQTMLALFLGVTAATAFRSGQRWSWWLFWALPLGGLLNSALLLSRAGINVFHFTIPFLVLSALGLFLPIRLFFPRTAAEPQATPA